MKRIMLAAILAVLVIACFAPAVMAAKPDSVGKPDKAEKTTGKPDKALDATPLDADAPEGDEVIAPTKGKPDKEAKINQGKLVSTVTKVRQEQFKLTKEQLKEMGYHGSMSEFATSYNEAMNGLKVEIRNKLQEESEFTTAVVRNLMERELAQIREELIESITVDDETLAEDVTEAVAGEEEASEEVTAAIEGEVEYMDEEFKAELLLTATVGTEEEQEALAEQLEEFAEAVDEEIEPVEVDVEVIRDELEAEEPLEEEETPAETPAIEEGAAPAAEEETPAIEAPAEGPAEEPAEEEPAEAPSTSEDLIVME